MKKILIIIAAIAAFNVTAAAPDHVDHEQRMEQRRAAAQARRAEQMKDPVFAAKVEAARKERIANPPPKPPTPEERMTAMRAKREERIKTDPEFAAKVLAAKAQREADSKDPAKVAAKAQRQDPEARMAERRAAADARRDERMKTDPEFAKKVNDARAARQAEKAAQNNQTKNSSNTVTNKSSPSNTVTNKPVDVNKTKPK